MAAIPTVTNFLCFSQRLLTGYSLWPEACSELERAIGRYVKGVEVTLARL